MEIELERTFLIKHKPKDLEKSKSFEIIDIYFPKSADHPILRIRKSGDKYFMTKKSPLVGNDSSEQGEQTIILSKEEWEELANLEGKRLRKIRYYYPFEGKTAEIDIYLDKLKGLGVVDFEFKTREEKNKFVIPDFCLLDVTQEKMTAGGILAGKKYKNIEPFLKKCRYTKL